MTHLYLSREELYEKVWATPILRLAPEYGLSDRGLAKLCARMQIPVPGLGYWRKVELGQTVKKERLPKPKEGCHLYTTFWVEGLIYKEEAKKQENDPWVVQAQEFESLPENQIIVPDSITSYHPLVKSTLKAVRAGYTNKQGATRPFEKEALDVYCAKASLPRLARFFHVFIRSLEKRGHTIEVNNRIEKPYQYKNSREGTWINYHSERIRISLVEKVDRSEHQKTPREEKYNSGPKYDFAPNGKFSLTVDNTYYYQGKQRWSDKKGKPLETQLNAILIDLAKIAVHLRARREKEEAKEREAERQRQEAEVRRQLRLAEENRVQQLEGFFSQWLKAKQMREFLSLVEMSSIRLESIDMNQEEWLAWAKNHAEQIDPLNQSPYN